MRFRTTKKRGFTLIELILGISILSVIGLTIYTIFSTGLQINRRSKSIEHLYRDAYLVSETLSLDLDNIINFHFSFKLETPQSAFKGSSTELSFLSAADGEIKRIRYYTDAPQEVFVHKIEVKEGAPRRDPFDFGRRTSIEAMRHEDSLFKTVALIREVRPFKEETEDSEQENKENEESEEIEREIISGNIQENSLRLFYNNTEDTVFQDEVEWGEEWVEPYLPDAVRLHLTLVHPGSETLYPMQRDFFIPMGSYGRQEF